MERRTRLKNNHGITLIALVISIIVMLILAGVSINAVVGDNGVLTQAKEATIKSRFATYLEEFEINKVDAMIEEGIYEDFSVNYKGTDKEFLRYVPSSEKSERDRENMEIIGGYLIFKGTDEQEKNSALSVGLKDEFDQEIYDSIGKEFEVYIKNFYDAIANGSISTAQYNAWKSKDIVAMNEFKSYAKIPDKYDGKFELQYGKIAYLEKNEDRLSVLANSQYLRSYIADGDFILANYIAPINGGSVSPNASTGYYEISGWVVNIYNSSGVIMYGTILGYNSSTTTYSILSIPDTFNCVIGGENKIVKITSIEGDGTNNIFSADNANTDKTIEVQKVMVAKNINKITKKGLANLGDNVQCHILYIGNDLILGNDVSDTNVIGNEGIENTCGSFTFVAPETREYTFKLWGASGGDGNEGYNKEKPSINGLGGYSQGTVHLEAGENIYCYIGGRGLIR